MNFNQFNKAESEMKFKGIVAQIYHKRFDDKTFEYVVLPDTARVIAITKNRKIILLKEKVFSFNKTYFSLPGGSIESDEDPRSAALRELEEETGYTSDDLELWFSQNYSQTIVSEKFYFIARNCKKNGAIKLGNGEEIEARELEYSEFFNHILKEEFKYTELQNKFLKMKIDEKMEDAFKNLLGI